MNSKLFKMIPIASCHVVKMALSVVLTFVLKYLTNYLNETPKKKVPTPNFVHFGGVGVHPPIPNFLTFPINIPTFLWLSIFFFYNCQTKVVVGIIEFQLLRQCHLYQEGGIDILEMKVSVIC